MRLPFIWRSSYNTVRRLLESAHEVIERQRKELLQTKLDARLLVEYEAAKEKAEYRAEAAERRYHELVTRLAELALPTPVQVPPPVAPLDPDVQTVRRLDDEVVKRMTQSFIEHERMSPEAAEAHARELVGAAEAMYLGG